MPSSLARAALTLLGVGAVVLGTALFPAALDVPLQPTGPASTPTPTASPTPTPTPTPTPSPAPTGTDAPPADTSWPSLPDLSSVPHLLAALGLVAVGAVVLSRARGVDWDAVDGDGLAAALLARVPFAGRIRRIPQFTTAVLLTGATALAGVAGGVGRAAGSVAVGLSSGVRPLARMGGRALLAVPGGVVVLLTAPVGALSTLRRGELPSLGGLFDRPDALEPDEPTTTDARVADDAGDDATPSDPAPTTLREAWGRLTAAVSVPNPAATTPGEYARRAVAAGLPAGPVWRLTRLVRTVAYGGESASESRTAAARRALADIFDGGGDGE